MANYQIQVLKSGAAMIPGPELFWMGGWDEWFPLTFNVVLIRGNGVTALINTGSPDDIGPLNDLFVAFLGEKGRMERPDDEKLGALLASQGVTPEEVTHAIITPFIQYATGGILSLPNAEVCVLKSGWTHFHTTHDHPHDNRPFMFTQDTLVHLMTDGWDRVRLLEDEDEVAPGIRTWFSGTHHRASMAVEIDTSDGVVVASDSFFHYENVEDNRLLGINESMYEGLATYDRARRVADHLIPLYDPKVFERYPDGIGTGVTSDG